MGGNLEILKWFVEIGHQMDLESVCTTAAVSGRLAIIKWAAEQRDFWDPIICKTAAKHCHIRILEWAENNGKPWDKQNCLKKTRDLKIKSWIESLIITYKN